MSKLIRDRLIVAVDFDGTITTQPDMGHMLELQPHCREVLGWCHQNGVELVLWTCRTGKVLEEALEFLRENDMLDFFVAINDQTPEVNAKYAPEVARKVGADMYIDDKNIGTSIDWLWFHGKIMAKKGMAEHANS